MLPLKLFIIFISIVDCANVGFFCNSGPYSHDAYSSHLAGKIRGTRGHNVSLIQIRVFQFKNRVPFSQKFENYISHDSTDDAATKKAQEKSQQLMWEVILPYDIYNGTLIGIYASLELQESYIRGCAAALDNRTFLENIKNLNLDLLIIDYAMNDCAIGLANILNIPAAYISSTPLGSNYIDYTGAPSNPAYVPVFMCNFEPYQDFYDKAFNVFGYVNLVIFRRLFYNRAYNMLYEKLDVKIEDLGSLERKTLMVSTPWEMFLDMPRPLARNLRYFGCENCMVPGKIDEQSTNFTMDIKNGAILVSFGTLVNAEDIPTQKLQEFIKAFAYFPNYVFIWQLDVSQEYFQENVLGPINMKMPSHVRLHRWIPMKQLLFDPKVILVITHGGATTCLEAAYGGKPILGVAIHSDQYHNTQRFAHRRLGEALSVLDIEDYVIVEELRRILIDQTAYKERATKFQQMLIDYRNFEKSSSTFWIDFLARHFGGKANETKPKLNKFWILHHPANWLVYHNSDIFLIWFMIFSFCVWCLG